jgi:hypothetical protein
MGPVQPEGLRLGGFPRAVERDDAVGVGVGWRERTLDEGVENDARRCRPRRTVQFREVEPCELASAALLGVVVAFVAHVQAVARRHSEKNAVRV